MNTRSVRPLGRDLPVTGRVRPSCPYTGERKAVADGRVPSGVWARKIHRGKKIGVYREGGSRDDAGGGWGWRGPDVSRPTRPGRASGARPRRPELLDGVWGWNSAGGYVPVRTRVRTRLPFGSGATVQRASTGQGRGFPARPSRPPAPSSLRTGRRTLGVRQVTSSSPRDPEDSSYLPPAPGEWRWEGRDLRSRGIAGGWSSRGKGHSVWVGRFTGVVSTRGRGTGLTNSRRGRTPTVGSEQVHRGGRGPWGFGSRRKDRYGTGRRTFREG